MYTQTIIAILCWSIAIELLILLTVLTNSSLKIKSKYSKTILPIHQIVQIYIFPQGEDYFIEL